MAGPPAALGGGIYCRRAPWLSNMFKSRDLAGVCLGGITILGAHCFFPFLKSPAM